MKKEPEKTSNGVPAHEALKIKRRTLLKALAGFPVLGLLGLKIAQKTSDSKQKKERILKSN